MSYFIAPLAAEQLGRWEWRLIRELQLADPEHELIVVPAGYLTNFASIRGLRVWLVLIYALLVGYGNASCAVHDFIYEEGRLTRRQCDDVLYRALRAEGVARWRAWLFFMGVRIGGKSHYNSTPANPGFFTPEGK
jgi:hypothetical protein